MEDEQALRRPWRRGHLCPGGSKSKMSGWPGALLPRASAWPGRPRPAPHVLSCDFLTGADPRVAPRKLALPTSIPPVPQFRDQGHPAPVDFLSSPVLGVGSSRSLVPSAPGDAARTAAWRASRGVTGGFWCPLARPCPCDAGQVGPPPRAPVCPATKRGQ